MNIKNLSNAAKLAKSKKPKLIKTKKSDFVRANSFRTHFLTSKAKKAFIHLQKAFTETLILRHFDLECYICIESDTSGYAINGVLSQMTSDHSDQLFSNHVTYENLDLISSKSKIGQWYPIAFFSQKMIPTETWYKTHNQELLAIVEAFKTWCHYLNKCKYKVFVLTDHNNLC